MIVLLTTLALAADPPPGVVLVDDDVEVELHAVVQGLADVDLETGHAGASLQRVRPDLRLRTADGVAAARVQAELAGGPARVLDAEVAVRPGSSWLFRAGRFLLPTGRQQLTPVGRLAFPGFAPSSDRWRRGRLVGAEARWTPESRHAVALGVFDGTPASLGALAVVRGTVGVGDAVPYNEVVVADGVRGLAMEACAQIAERHPPVVQAGAVGRWDRVRVEVEGTVDTGAAAEWGAFGQVDLGIVPDRVQGSFRVDRTRGLLDRSWTVESSTILVGAGGHLRGLLGLAAAHADRGSWSPRARAQVQWTL